MPVPQDEYQHCPNCHMRWKLWHFEPLPGDPPEVEGWCLSCRRTERYIRQAGIERKRCVNCGEMKPLSDFLKRKDTRDGRNSWCGECMRSPARGLRKKRAS